MKITGLFFYEEIESLTYQKPKVICSVLERCLFLLNIIFTKSFRRIFNYVNPCRWPDYIITSRDIRQKSC